MFNVFFSFIYFWWLLAKLWRTHFWEYSEYRHRFCASNDLTTCFGEDWFPRGVATSTPKFFPAPKTSIFRPIFTWHGAGALPKTLYNWEAQPINRIYVEFANKTANIKYKKLISLQYRVRASESHVIQNMICAVLDVWLRRPYTVLQTDKFLKIFIWVNRYLFWSTNGAKYSLRVWSEFEFPRFSSTQQDRRCHAFQFGCGLCKCTLNNCMQFVLYSCTLRIENALRIAHESVAAMPRSHTAYSLQPSAAAAARAVVNTS